MRTVAMDTLLPYPEDGAKGDTGEKGDKGDKGDTGLGVQEETCYYALSTSGETHPRFVLATFASGSQLLSKSSDWKTTPQTPTATKRWHWKAVLRTWTDGVMEVIGPEVIGTYGEKGDQGDPGDPGEAGESVLTSYIFCRSTEQPAVPTDWGSYEEPNPPAEGVTVTTEAGSWTWYDGAPTDDGGHKPVWMTRRVLSNKTDSTLATGWSEATLLVDTATMDVEFAEGETRPEDPEGHPNVNTVEHGGSWSDTMTEATVWMAISTLVSGVWSDWRVCRVKGEKGDTGDDGDDGDDGNGVATEAVFFTLTAVQQQPTATIGRIERNGVTVGYVVEGDDETEWTGSMVQPDSEKRYLWACRLVTYTRSEPKLIGPYVAGVWSDGVQGAQGKVPYAAGEWNAQVTYTPTQTTTPYVYYNGQWYVLVAEEETKGVVPTEDTEGTTWQHMEHYEQLLVNALVAQLGRVGAAVYYGDYMFSQYGVDADRDENTTTAAPPEEDDWGDLYTNFCNSTNLSGFTPNLMMDFKNGRLWATDAYIFGKVYATEGYFSGEVRAQKGSFKNGTFTNCSATNLTAKDGTFTNCSVTGDLTCNSFGHTVIVASGAECEIDLLSVKGDYIVGNAQKTTVHLGELSEGVCREYTVLNTSETKGGATVLNMYFDAVHRGSDGLETTDGVEVYSGTGWETLSDSAAIAGGLYKLVGYAAKNDAGTAVVTTWRIVKVST